MFTCKVTGEAGGNTHRVRATAQNGGLSERDRADMSFWDLASIGFRVKLNLSFSLWCTSFDYPPDPAKFELRNHSKLTNPSFEP